VSRNGFNGFADISDCEYAYKNRQVILFTLKGIYCMWHVVHTLDVPILWLSELRVRD